MRGALINHGTMMVHAIDELASELGPVGAAVPPPHSPVVSTFKKKLPVADGTRAHMVAHGRLS